MQHVSLGLGRILILAQTPGRGARLTTDFAQIGAPAWATSSPAEALRLAVAIPEVTVLLVDCPLVGRAEDFVVRFQQLRPEVSIVGLCGVADCEPCSLGVNHSLRGHWVPQDLVELLEPGHLGPG